MRNELIKNAIIHAKMARYAPADLAFLYRNHARALIAEARGIQLRGTRIASHSGAGIINPYR